MLENEPPKGIKNISKTTMKTENWKEKLILKNDTKQILILFII